MSCREPEFSVLEMSTQVPGVIAFPTGKGNRIYYPGTHWKLFLRSKQFNLKLKASFIHKTGAHVPTANR